MPAQTTQPDINHINEVDISHDEIMAMISEFWGIALVHNSTETSLHPSFSVEDHPSACELSDLDFHEFLSDLVWE